VRYDVPGVTLYPGESYPDENGCVIGIHYSGWERFLKRNDQSCNLSEILLYNPEISVHSGDIHVVKERAIHVIRSRRDLPGKREEG
jgi:hypothetical protein